MQDPQYDRYTETHPFPSTRYQGSKSKIADWIHSMIEGLEFDTALDAFGGTGSISHMMKRMGKEVTYNDILRSNHISGKALIENNGTRLEDSELEMLFEMGDHPSFIRDTFQGIYYTDEENDWLDGFVSNVESMDDGYKRSIAYHALFQACLGKRPYNLFHRANLYMRTSDVSRGFGNKTTWERPFPELVARHARECNRAVFDNGRTCRSINEDASSIKGDYDLVYIDTPYIDDKGGSTDYLGYYHFLEGLADYEEWKHRIDPVRKHKPIRGAPRGWMDKRTIASDYERLIDRFSDSILVISYRSDGIPSIDELAEMVQVHKDDVVIRHCDYRYALSKKGTGETVIIGS